MDFNERILSVWQGTRTELARRAGITERHLRRLMRGHYKRGPQMSTIHALAGVLGVSPGWLAFGDGNGEGQ